MKYDEALEFISSTYKFGEKIGLENITRLMAKLGDPQNKLKYVHVAGTNGKGSTAAMLANVLYKAGYKTGLYISPYLERFNERMQINNIPIADDELAQDTQTVKNAIEELERDGYPCPSEFEVVTAVAFVYYAKNNVDIVVLEVGMGGRMDATNIIASKEAAVITSLSLDHQLYLGNTIEDIAFEKAGIIKQGNAVSVYALDPPETVSMIQKACDERGASLKVCDKKDVKLLSYDIDGQTIKYTKPDSVLGVDTVKVALLGKHQTYNTLNVLNTLEILKKRGWNITPEAITEGLATVKFTGRFEIMHKDPVIVIDGGHNIEGITSFVDNVKTYFKGKKVVLFYGMLSDKQVNESVALLHSVAKRVYTLTPTDERAVTAQKMADYIKENYPEMPVVFLKSFEDIKKHIDFSQKDEIYAFTGSLYMIGEARTILTSLISQKGAH